MMHTLEVLWTGNTAVYAATEKVTPFQLTRVPWEFFQKRPGMVKQMLPLKTFKDNLKERPKYYSSQLARFARREAHATREDAEQCEKWNNVFEQINEIQGQEAALISFFLDYISEDEQEQPEALESKTNEELRDMCREAGLPVYGAKDALVERLEEAN